MKNEELEIHSSNPNTVNKNALDTIRKENLQSLESLLSTVPQKDVKPASDNRLSVTKDRFMAKTRLGKGLQNVSKQFAESQSISEPSSIAISIEVTSLKEITESIDEHLKKFLREMLEEFQSKTKERKLWTKKIWRFTVSLVWSVGLVFLINSGVTLFLDKSFIDTKVLFTVIIGVFAQVISLMLIIMRYVFSPSKDVYNYLTELVKVRKLKNNHGDVDERSTSSDDTSNGIYTKVQPLDFKSDGSKIQNIDPVNKKITEEKPSDEEKGLEGTTEPKKESAEELV